MKDSKEVEMWQSYAASKSVEDRNKIIELYIPFAEALAAKIHLSAGIKNMHIEDSKQFGVLGMMKAVERYDVDSKCPFPGYAYYYVKGSVMDAYRESFHLERGYYKRMSDAGKGSVQLFEIDFVKRPELEDTFTPEENLPYGEEFTHVHEDSIELELDLKIMTDLALRGVSPRTRDMLKMYYSDGLRMHQIASVVGLTESRVSQCIQNSLVRMKRSLEKRDITFA